MRNGFEKFDSREAADQSMMEHGANSENSSKKTREERRRVVKEEKVQNIRVVTSDPNLNKYYAVVKEKLHSDFYAKIEHQRNFNLLSEDLVSGLVLMNQNAIRKWDDARIGVEAASLGAAHA